MAIIAPGTAVPEFRLAREDGADFTRESLLGRTTVLVFYPFAFSSVCTDQLQVYEEAIGDIRAGDRRVGWTGRRTLVRTSSAVRGTPRV